MRLLVLAALLSAHYANADMTTDLKSGDFKAAYNSSLKEFRSTNREAQTMIDTYERVHKNINFQSNELLCKPDQSDAYHHACLGFTMEREMVSGKFWQDTVGRIAPDLLKIDADVKAHYEKQIQEKAASLAAKIRSEVETKLSECQAGTTIEELEKEKDCIQSIGKKYVGGIFSNSLYQKHVAAGPVYATLAPRLDSTESKLKDAIAKWQASPEGQLQEAAFHLCNAHSGKKINEQAVSDEQSVRPARFLCYSVL
ncbi:MAG: hypothetical protein JNM24_04645 [Bdellovibrionaceae bacterium]|nr:hypothetical protein [Pseudobdellovibrionaceae bacterium]